MLIADLANAGAAPVLEQMMRFAGQRQRLLAHNVANIATPDFRPADVSPSAFQRQLAAAIDERRAAGGGERGALNLRDTREVRRTGDGGLAITPRTPSGGVLFHDRNNRDVVGLMQDLAENALAFRTAADLMRWHQGMIRAAIAQRP